MYTAFFGLKQDPFSISPDPRFLFMSERHREALAHLLYGVQGAGGIVLLTGDIGAGKTTISRRFLEQAPERCQVAYIFNPRLNVIELLRSICDEFGVALALPTAREPTVKEIVDPLNAFLLGAHAAGRNPVLVIDEAQNLSAEVLEQLRLLTNLETDERKLLQIVLIGQPELRQLLASPVLEQLAQRVVARFHLGPLDASDMLPYVQHRMGVAGLTGPVPFSTAALRRLHQLSGGVPRRVNLLCGRALLGAYAQGQREVGPAVVERAAAEVFSPLDAALPPSRPNRRLGFLALGLLLGSALTAGAFWLALRPGATPVVAAPPRPPAAPTAPVAPSAVPPLTGNAAPAPTRLPAPAEPPEAPTAAPTAEVEPTAADLLSDEAAGVRAIGPAWQWTTDAAKPCDLALAQQLQCYRTPRMTLAGLREMDRPAVLRLRLPDGVGYAVLDAMDADRVSLRAGTRRWTWPLTRLSKAWRGDYLSLWRIPPGQRGHLANGYSPSAAAWMAQRLDILQKQGELPESARSLRDKVEAFQRARGIEINGLASPTTLILLNRASGVEEPRLSSVIP